MLCLTLWVQYKVLGGKDERDFIYAESIYPNQTYKAAIKSKTHKYYFETDKVVDDNGSIDISNYKCKTIRADKDTIGEKDLNYYKIIKDHVNDIT